MTTQDTAPPRQPGENWCERCRCWRWFKGPNCVACGWNTYLGLPVGHPRRPAESSMEGA